MEGLKPIRVIKKDSEKLEQPLSPIARLFHEPYSNVYGIMIMGFKTPINSDIIKSNMANTFLKHPYFSSLQVKDKKNCGEIRWLKIEVDIENHVIVPNLDEANIDCPDKFVEDYVSNLSKTTIRNSIPMWDFHILNIKTSEAESIGILRTHHSLGDGISLMSLLLSCSRKVSDPQALPTIPNLRRSSSNSMKSKGLLQFFIKIWLLVLLCWNTFVDLVMLLITIFFLEDTKTPLKSTLKKCGSTPRRFVHTTISLDDVKLVKNLMDATINDVIVGVIQAGLSRYLNRKYGNEDNTEDQKSNLPSNILLRATTFVNMRSSVGIHDLEEMMRRDSKAKWGNKICYVLLPLKIALQNDPLEHVRHAKVSAHRTLKASLQAKFIYFMAKFLIKLFGTKVMSLVTQTTLCFSNIPGPQEEISFHGHPVAFIAPSCYGQPTALLIHVISYVNKMKIILSVDESIIPDPHQICEDLQNSLKLIKDAVLSKGVVN